MELLKKMCFISGTSCHENEIRKYIYDEIKDYVDELSIDKLGNLIARKKGEGIKLALVTHIDECGFFATVNDNEKQRFGKIGEVDIKSVTNTNLLFENGVKGKLLCEEKKDSIKDFYMQTKNDYSGLTAVFYPSFIQNEDYLIAPNLSSRVGIFSLINAIKNNINSYYDIYYCFTVQKHTGFKGAKTVLNTISPDFTLNIDLFDCNYIDSATDAVILCKDKQYLANQILKDVLIYIANKANIKFSLCVGDFTTQTSKLINSTNGSKGVCIGIPVKHMNSPGESCNINDIDELNKLIVELIRSDNL